MSDNENDKKTAAVKSIVDAVFDLGTTWVEYGLVQGKTALENGSRALARTAKTLGDIETALKSDVPPARAQDDVEAA